MVDDKNKGSACRAKRLIFIGKILNLIVLLCSLIIFVGLSIEILNVNENVNQKLYSRVQLAICVIFLIDFFFLFSISGNKKKYFFYNFLFLLISIPYLNIIEWFNIPIDSITRIILRAILLIRGGYGLVIMINWFTSNIMNNLLFSYTVILIGTAYFGSLVFYTLEKPTNTGIRNFGDAVWWACMDVTTVGCDIEPTTTPGRVLAVILAVLGMSMFPILTAYITNMFQAKMKNKDNNAMPGNPSNV